MTPYRQADTRTVEPPPPPKPEIRLTLGERLWPLPREAEVVVFLLAAFALGIGFIIALRTLALFLRPLLPIGQG
jgi:hypothetical protein